MSQSNQNSSQGGATNSKGRNNTQIVFWVIIAILLAGCIYLFMRQKQVVDQRNADNVMSTAKIDSIEKERKALEEDFKAATGKIDQLMSQNAKTDSALQRSKKELVSLQTKIQVVVKKDKASLDELKKAREEIKELNSKISAYEERIAELEKENRELTGKNEVLVAERDTVVRQNKVLKKIGSVLHTSNIRLTPERKRRNGTERETKRAKHTDILRITFDIDENNIAESGTKQIYLRLVAPDKTILSNTANSSGTITTAKGEKVNYSVVKEIALTKGVPVKDVVVDWNQDGNYQKGQYDIEFFSEGYQVGKGSVTLK